MTSPPFESERVAFKGFDLNLQGRGFQFEVGKTHLHTGHVKMCDSGFHACQNPLKVVEFYPPINGNRFAKVTMRGAMDGCDSAWWSAAELMVIEELTFPALVHEAIDWAWDPAYPAEKQDAYRNASCAEDAKNASTESYVANASSGDHSINATGGDHAKNASSGDHSANISSGNDAMNASSGRGAENASSGLQAANACSGDHAVNASIGPRAMNASAGDHAINASSGEASKNASSGDSAINASSGDHARSVSSGDFGKNEATGAYSVISGAGRDTLYRGAMGTWVSAAEYAEVHGEWHCIGFAVGRAGYDGVPADTWLIARGGKLVPAPLSALADE